MRENREEEEEEEEEPNNLDSFLLLKCMTFYLRSMHNPKYL